MSCCRRHFLETEGQTALPWLNWNKSPHDQSSSVWMHTVKLPLLTLLAQCFVSPILKQDSWQRCLKSGLARLFSIRFFTYSYWSKFLWLQLWEISINIFQNIFSIAWNSSNKDREKEGVNVWSILGIWLGYRTGEGEFSEELFCFNDLCIFPEYSIL